MSRESRLAAHFSAIRSIEPSFHFWLVDIDDVRPPPDVVVNDGAVVVVDVASSAAPRGGDMRDNLDNLLLATEEEEVFSCIPPRDNSLSGFTWLLLLLLAE